MYFIFMIAFLFYPFLYVLKRGLFLLDFSKLSFFIWGRQRHERFLDNFIWNIFILNGFICGLHFIPNHLNSSKIVLLFTCVDHHWHLFRYVLRPFRVDRYILISRTKLLFSHVLDFLLQLFILMLKLLCDLRTNFMSLLYHHTLLRLKDICGFRCRLVFTFESKVFS